MSKIYQDWKVFQDLYSFNKSDKINSGTQGTVYKSGNFAIKKITKLQYFVDEVVFGITINHPNILKLIAWSTDNKCYYICYPLGLDVKKMYNQNKISLDNIISHTLSAVFYLFKQEIYHGDMYIDNLIYHDERIKVIDFGSCSYNVDNLLHDFGNCISLFEELTIPPYCQKLQFLVDARYKNLPNIIINNLEFLNVKKETISTKRCRDFEMFEISKNDYNLNKFEMQKVNELLSKCLNMNMKRDKSLEDSCIWICCKSRRKSIQKEEDVILLIVKTLG